MHPSAPSGRAHQVPWFDVSCRTARCPTSTSCTFRSRLRPLTAWRATQHGYRRFLQRFCARGRRWHDKRAPSATRAALVRERGRRIGKLSDLSGQQGRARDASNPSTAYGRGRYPTAAPVGAARRVHGGETRRCPGDARTPGRRREPRALCEASRRYASKRCGARDASRRGPTKVTPLINRSPAMQNAMSIGWPRHITPCHENGYCKMQVS